MSKARVLLALIALSVGGCDGSTEPDPFSFEGTYTLSGDAEDGGSAVLGTLTISDETSGQAQVLLVAEFGVQPMFSFEPSGRVTGTLISDSISFIQTGTIRQQPNGIPVAFEVHVDGKLTNDRITVTLESFLTDFSPPLLTFAGNATATRTSGS